MASSPHPLPAQEEKTLPGEGTLGGTYLLLPFPHTPALSLPDSGREIQVPSETRPNMPAQAAHKRAHTHTHTRARALLGRWGSAGRGLDKSTGVGKRGDFSACPKPGLSAHGWKRTHVHICSTGGGWRYGLGPRLWRDGKQFRRPWEGGGVGSVHLVTDVAFAQIKKKRKKSPNQLQILVSQLEASGYVCEIVQKRRG